MSKFTRALRRIFLGLPNVTWTEVAQALREGGPLQILRKDFGITDFQAHQKQVCNGPLSALYFRNKIDGDLRESYDVHILGKPNGFLVCFNNGEILDWKPSVPQHGRPRDPDDLNPGQRMVAFELLQAIRRCLEFA